MPAQIRRRPVSVVTGGSKGIGAAVVAELHQAGHDVAILDLDASGEAVARDLDTAGRLRVLFIAADVSRERAVRQARRMILERFGPPQVLVNNAGIFPRQAARELSLKEWNRVLSINLTAMFVCARLFAEDMFSLRRGCIVNLSSTYSLAPGLNGAHYAASKAGVLGLTRALALEWAPTIRVNAVLPGTTLTDQARAGAKDDEELRARGERIPLARIAEPVDIARVVRFLASDDAGYITGQTILVNGGSYMH